VTETREVVEASFGGLARKLKGENPNQEGAFKVVKDPSLSQTRRNTVPF